MSLADKFYSIIGVIVLAIISIPVLFVGGYILSGIVSAIPPFIWILILCFAITGALNRN